MAKKILIVDDDPLLAGVISHEAQRLGLHCDSVSSWSLARNHVDNYSSIFLDLMMPEIDGVAVLRELGALQRKPSVILMSGLDSKILLSAAHLAEMHGIRIIDSMPKPFNPVRLNQILGRLCGDLGTRFLEGKESIPIDAGTITLEDLSEAILEGHLDIEYQPQIKISDNSCVSVECLARWDHKTLGRLQPGRFIKFAESSALALPFTFEVIRKSVESLKRLQATCGYTGRIAVNVPPTALTDVQFPDVVADIMSRSGIDTSLLTIEITETALPVDLRACLDIETRLRMRGISLSIDDFGTGLSSLERLHVAPFDELKIDQCFVRDAAKDNRLRSIAENAVKLAHELGMVAVAEGVEDQSALNWLKDIGCDVAQGFFIGRPMTLDDLCKWGEETGRKP